LGGVTKGDTVSEEFFSDEISDGYHTFGELYEHRAVLFIALMKLNPQISWYASRHEDDSMFPGFFIAGMQLPVGQVSYHLHIDPWWQLLQNGGHVPCHTNAPKWDGHTPQMSLDRIVEWIETL
jgi:hypothetical protein